MIKCVIWDLDNTLFRGVYLETPDQRPPADPAAIKVLHELSGRGILQAIASRNPQEAASYATELTGHSFASVQCGWGAKSAAVSAVLTELGLVPAEAAFVDDDAMERAEVSFRLPDVLVLDPRDLADVPSWPQFSPPVITEEGRRRGELYLQRQARQQEAKTFGGSVEEFLRQADTKVSDRPGQPARRGQAGRTLGPHPPVQLGRPAGQHRGVREPDQRSRPAGDHGPPQRQVRRRRPRRRLASSRSQDPTSAGQPDLPGHRC